MFVWAVLTFLEQMAEGRKKERKKKERKKEERTFSSTRVDGFAATKNSSTYRQVDQLSLPFVMSMAPPVTPRAGIFHATTSNG